MNPNQLLGAASILAVLTIPGLQAQTYDFNTAATDYTSNFTPTTNSSWSATGGVNGSGGVILPTGLAGAGLARGPHLTTSPLSASANQSFALETFFHRSGQDNASGGNQKFFALGLSTTTALTTADAGLGLAPAGQSTFGVLLVTNASTAGDVTSFRWRISGSTNGGATSASVPTNIDFPAGIPNFNLSDNTWVKLETVFTKTAVEGVWSVSAAIYDYGTAGVSAPVLVSSFTGATVPAGQLSSAGGVYSAANVHAGFAFGNIAGSPTTGLTDAIDNFSFSVIPEPSAFATLAGLGALASTALRRRRRVL